MVGVKTRYWSATSDVSRASGALNFPKTSFSSTEELDNRVYDIHNLPDNQVTSEENVQTVKVLGGTFPSYDYYSVSAQGLHGTMRPYAFQGNMYRQNVKNKDTQYEVKHLQQNSSVNSREVSFRFVNDFSNSLRYPNEDASFDFSGSRPVRVKYNYPTTGAADETIDGYDNNRLAGSRHIEHFTNREIYDGIAQQKGFVDCREASQQAITGSVDNRRAGVRQNRRIYGHERKRCDLSLCFARLCLGGLFLQ